MHVRISCIFFYCRVVKLTSPNINYFVIIGAYIQYTSIFFRVLPSTDPDVNLATCLVSTVMIVLMEKHPVLKDRLVLWLQSLLWRMKYVFMFPSQITSMLVIAGYCFGYGAILAKMGRIYYIFNNPTTNKKVSGTLSNPQPIL